MFARLLALFLILPVVELALLIRVGGVIGFWPTVGLVVGTGFLGSYLARREGLSAWRRFQQSLNAGTLPGRELLDGVIILLAGALLITPGVLSDVIGMLGLLPFTRAPIRAFILKRIRRAMERGTLRVGFGGLDVNPWVDPPAGPPPAGGWQGAPRMTPGARDDAPPPGPGEPPA